MKLIVEDRLSEKIVIVKEELDGIDIDYIGDLEDLLRKVFLHEKWGNLKVFLDGGELTKNNHEKPGVSQVYRCPLRDKCFKREYFFNKYGNQWGKYDFFLWVSSKYLEREETISCFLLKWIEIALI